LLDIKTEATHGTAVTVFPHDTAVEKAGRNPEEIFDDFHRFEPLDEEEELLLLLNNKGTSTVKATIATNSLATKPAGTSPPVAHKATTTFKSLFHADRRPVAALTDRAAEVRPTDAVYFEDDWSHRRPIPAAQLTATDAVDSVTTLRPTIVAFSTSRPTRLRFPEPVSEIDVNEIGDESNEEEIRGRDDGSIHIEVTPHGLFRPQPRAIQPIFQVTTPPFLLQQEPATPVPSPVAAAVSSAVTLPPPLLPASRGFSSASVSFTQPSRYYQVEDLK
jgi:hypothetical protein